MACGRLGNYDAVPPLVALLEVEKSNTSAAAHRALVEITDLPFPPEPERWNRWLQQEQNWWEEEADQVLRNVRSKQPGVPAKALRTLATKRLYRDDIARSLVQALPVVDSNTALMICGVLESIGYRSVEVELRAIEAGMPGGRVREAVLELLSALGPGTAEGGR